MYMEASAAPMVKNFCIVYIEMAFERAPLKVSSTLSAIQNLIFGSLGDSIFNKFGVTALSSCTSIIDLCFCTGKRKHGSHASGKYFEASSTTPRDSPENCY